MRWKDKYMICKQGGVVTEAAMECMAPVILVASKSLTGIPKYILCADFRDLNAVTKVPQFVVCPWSRRTLTTK
jgi:hypothetical protein